MSYFAQTQDIVPLVVLLALSRLKKNVTYWLRRMYSVPNLLQCPCFCNNILRNNTVNLNNNYPTTYHWTLSAVPHRQQHTVHSRNTNLLLEWKTISATNIFRILTLVFRYALPLKLWWFLCYGLLLQCILWLFHSTFTAYLIFIFPWYIQKTQEPPL